MKRSAFFLAALVILITGCRAQSAPGPYSTLTIAPPLNPYQSASSTPVPPTPTVPLPTVQPLIPSPTPFTHTVQPGETLFGIAVKYNISLDSLVSANPGMDTALLAVGTELVIPLAEDEDLIPPTATPYPISPEKPACYTTADGSLWCYSLLENDQPISLENIAVAFNIYDEDQNLVQSQIAYPPLNVLYPEQRMPVGALITDPRAAPDRISATLLSAFASDQDAPLVLISEFSLEYTQDNTIARVSGSFEILAEDSAERQVWIAAVALSDGLPAAVRKWISDEGLAPGESHPFEFQLYSLGPRIDRVQLFGELH